jgi:hypothetical protein
MTTTKIIIAGGRDFCNPKYYPAGSKQYLYDEQKAFRQVSALLWLNRTKDHPDPYEGLEIVSGCAKGADTVGESFALGNGIPLKRFPADWDTHGAGAGPIRNRQMGDYADRLIAFWDGESRGTKGMIDYAKESGLLVRVIKYAKQ